MKARKHTNAKSDAGKLILIANEAGDNVCAFFQIAFGNR